MKDKILAALKTEFTNLGFSEKALQGVAEALASTNLVTDENLDAVVKGQKPALTAMQSEIDSRVTTAVKKAKEGTQPEPPAPPEPQKPNPQETPEQKALREMRAELDALKSGKTHETLSAKVVAQLEAKKLPKSFIQAAIAGRTFEKEEDIEPFVTQVETSHNEYVQELSNQGLATTYNPVVVTATPEKQVEADIKAWADKNKPAAVPPK